MLAHTLKILFVTDLLPGFMGMGAMQRATHLYESLAKIGDVDTFLLVNESFDPAKWPEENRRRFRMVGYARMPKRGERGLWRNVRPVAPKLVDRVSNAIGSPAAQYEPYAATADALRRCIAAGNYDVVVSRYLLQSATAGLLSHRPLIIDLDDLDTVGAQTRSASPEQNVVRRAILRHKAACVERAVPPLWGNWSLAWLCCDSDAKVVESACADAHREASVAMLPNIPIPPSHPAPPPPGRKTILSVAALNYRPNYGGIDWFVRRVWPELRKRQPEASYHIVGRGLPKPLADKWSAVPGVKLCGFVENLEDEYAACDFAIAPVFEGAGTKIKVLESLAHGRTCVLTSHAWRGYEQSLHNGDEVFVADEPEQMTKFCDGLLSAPARCNESGVKGRDIVDRDYSRSRFDSIVQKSVERVLSAPPGAAMGDEGFEPPTPSV